MSHTVRVGQSPGEIDRFPAWPAGAEGMTGPVGGGGGGAAPPPPPPREGGGPREVPPRPARLSSG
jgi:hypothetical protein